MKRWLLVLALLLAPSRVAGQDRLLHGIQIAAVAGLTYEFAAHRFSRLNDAADRLEQRLPQSLQYARWGDPITWFQHAAWTAAAAGAGGLLGLATGSGFRHGAEEFSRLAIAFYIARELHERRGLDSVMDAAAPLAVGAVIHF